jgi:hypothetical protein
VIGDVEKADRLVDLAQLGGRRFERARLPRKEGSEIEDGNILGHERASVSTKRSWQRPLTVKPKELALG